MVLKPFGERVTKRVWWGGGKVGETYDVMCIDIYINKSNYNVVVGTGMGVSEDGMGNKGFAMVKFGQHLE